MRSVVQTLVAAIDPYDDEEREHIATTRRWLASGAPFIRTVPPDEPPEHLVSYAVLVDRSEEQLLLVDHRKALLWLPVGGHVEPDEHPRVTAARELTEELRLSPTFLFDEPLFLTINRTVGNTAGHVDVSLWFVLEASSRSPVVFDQAECAGVRWFSFDAIPWERTDRHMCRFATKLQARLRKLPNRPDR